MDQYRVPVLLDHVRGALAACGLNPVVTRVRFDEGAQRFSVRVVEPYMRWLRENGLVDAVTGDLLSIPGDVAAVIDSEDLTYLVEQQMERLLAASDLPSGLLWQQDLIAPEHLSL